MKARLTLDFGSLVLSHRVPDGTKPRVAHTSVRFAMDVFSTATSDEDDYLMR